MGMTSFGFSNCLQNKETKPSCSVQCEHENDIITACNEYEQIITSYLLIVLEDNIQKNQQRNGMLMSLL